MIELFLTFLSLTIFVGFLIFALWFGAALLVIMLVSGAFLALFIVFRGYYLHWRYGKIPPNTSHTETTTTIIDVEYKDVDGK